MPKKIPKIVKEIRNNPPSPVNYAYQKNISYSQMSIFRGCPHRWKLQYKDKIKRFTSSIHTVFGSAIHEAMQHYLDVMYTKSIVAADKIDLHEYFNKAYIAEYKKQIKSNNNEHFSSATEMREFYDDGIAILDFFKKKRNSYFSKRKTYLVGCELPIVLPPNPSYSNTLYMGFLDLVLYNENSETFTIIDLKTSTRGWQDKDKKNEEKQYQLLLYKKYFSEQYNVPIENIDIEFFILKRKVFENKYTEAEPSRVQEFRPAAGKIKLKRADKAINDFINECFNVDGSFKERLFDKNPSKFNCGFCPYKEDKELCGLGTFS